MLTNIPDKLFRAEFKKLSKHLPKENNYGVGMIFLPPQKKEQLKLFKIIDKFLKENQLILFHVRNVPVNRSTLSKRMQESEPVIKQFFVKAKNESNIRFLEKKLFIISKQISNKITKLAERNKFYQAFYISSFSNRVITYKGMLLSDLVRKYFLDLNCINWMKGQE